MLEPGDRHAQAGEVLSVVEDLLVGGAQADDVLRTLVPGDRR